MDDYRPMGFETDVANRNFIGAQNPDELIHSEFYWHEPEDWNKSQEQGKMVRGPKIPYVRIMNPGDKTSIMETPVREEHKARWPKKWLYWQMKEGLVDAGENIPGWKVDEWEHLTKEQIFELKYLRFHVVEQIAGASDSQVQSLGMGGLGLREQARQALKNRMGSEVRDEIAKKDKELSDMKERLAKLEALLTAPKKDDSTAPEVASVSDYDANVKYDVTEARERDDLVAKYVAKFGKKPHSMMNIGKLRARVA